MNFFWSQQTLHKIGNFDMIKNKALLSDRQIWR